MSDDESKASFTTHASTYDRHRLSSTNHGESAIELLAQRIETRRENRIQTPAAFRKKLLREFYSISVKEGYTDTNRIHYEDLVELRKDAEDESCTLPAFMRALGFVDERELKLEIFRRAERVVEESEMKEEGWFYYRDFMVCVFCTKSMRIAYALHRLHYIISSP